MLKPVAVVTNSTSLYLADNLLHLAGHRVGALQGSGIRQQNIDKETVTHVFFRDETARQQFADDAGTAADHRDENDKSHDDLAGHNVGKPGIGHRGAVENRVEQLEKKPQGPAVGFGLFQQQGTQGRTEGQGIDRRNGHRHGDGDGELLVEPPGNAPHGRHRDEDRDEHQGGGDHRGRHLVHGVNGGLFGVHPLFDVDLNRLHHHDGVVHHDADGQHEPQQRQHVDGEPQQGKGHERPQEGDRNRDGGNQGGAPVLDENKDHQDDQRQGDE